MRISDWRSDVCSSDLPWPPLPFACCLCSSCCSAGFTMLRRLMAEERLIVKTPRRRRFSAYAGDPTPAVPNLLNRDFHASVPNTKWLTDLTEIHITAGKVYVSPIVDCFDGLVVAWNIGTSPDANLRSEARRVGKGCDRTFRTRWSA